MMNQLNLLFADAAPATIADKTMTALQTLVFGMLIVFSVMIIIMLTVTLIGKIFQAIDKKKQMKTQLQQAVTPAAPEQTQPEETAPAQDDAQIVAAITAAISVYLEEPVGSFRVVSFKKTAAKPAWNKNK